jgi:DNA recombination protein RmuC
LRTEVENLSHRLFEDKGKAFLGEGRVQLEQVLAPLKERLAEFQRQAAEAHQTDTRERASLKQELAQLLGMQTRLGDEARQLSRALAADTRIQGTWGELNLERLLEASQLQRGVAYDLQVSARDDEGGRGRPDAVVWLPDNKAVVVDAKVSLTAFQRACNAGDDGDRQTALADHVRSVRAHVRGLAGRSYPQLDLGGRTLDMVLLFLPSEPAFAAALSTDPALWTDSWQAGVILVSPTTLLATLRVVAQIWRVEQQNANAAAIAAEAGRMLDKLQLFIASMDDVGAQLERARGSWEQSMRQLSTGRGNLIARARKVHGLGAVGAKAATTAMLQPDGGTADDAEVE